MIQQKQLLFDGEKLPLLEDAYDKDVEDVEDDEDVEDKKPTTSAKIFNLDKGINDDHKEFLSQKKLELPSAILKNNIDVDDSIKKVESKSSVLKITLKDIQPKLVNLIQN